MQWNFDLCGRPSFWCSYLVICSHRRSQSWVIVGSRRHLLSFIHCLSLIFPNLRRFNSFSLSRSHLSNLKHNEARQSCDVVVFGEVIFSQQSFFSAFGSFKFQPDFINNLIEFQLSGQSNSNLTKQWSQIVRPLRVIMTLQLHWRIIHSSVT